VPGHSDGRAGFFCFSVDPSARFVRIERGPGVALGNEDTRANPELWRTVVMRRVLLPGLAGLLGLMLFAGGSSFGDDQPTAKQAKKQKHTANKPVAPEGAKATTATAADQGQAAKTHLPAGFGKVNLTPEQHQKATAVMEKYAGQIKQLESQIHELKAKRTNELTALLTDTQKQSLAEAKTNSQKVKEEKKAVAGKTMTTTRRGFQVDPKAIEAYKAELATQSQPKKEQPKVQPTAPEKK
jgi:hypothetical protein